MALAFALIKQMLKLENRSKEACDFGRDLWIASRAATCAKNNVASLPQINSYIMLATFGRCDMHLYDLKGHRAGQF